jgi:hypothetical protein
MIGEQAHVQWDQDAKGKSRCQENIQQRNHEDADKNSSKETKYAVCIKPFFQKIISETALLVCLL